MIYTTKVDGRILVANTHTLQYYDAWVGRFSKLTRQEMAHFLKMWRKYNLKITRES
jgi:hypothetical protein